MPDALAEFSFSGVWARGEDGCTLLGVWRQHHHLDDRKQSDFTYLPALGVLPLRGSLPQALGVTLQKADGEASPAPALSEAAPLSDGLVGCFSLVSWKHSVKSTTVKCLLSEAAAGKTPVLLRGAVVSVKTCSSPSCVEQTSKNNHTSNQVEAEDLQDCLQHPRGIISCLIVHRT